jgi:hypothetical protein
MLANECTKCSNGKQKLCNDQFINARKNDKIYCPKDGSILYINLEY